MSPGGAPGQPCGQTWPLWPRPPRPRPSPRPASACVVLPAPDQVHPRDADLFVGEESPGPGTASLRAGVTGGRWERRPVRPRKSLAPQWPFPGSAGVRPSLTGSATFTALSEARRRPGSRLARALRARASNASPTASSSLSHVSAEARSRSRVAAESTGCHAGRHRSAVGGGSVHGHNVGFQVPDESDVCVFWTGGPGSGARPPCWSHGRPGVLAPGEGTCAPGGRTGVRGHLRPSETPGKASATGPGTRPAPSALGPAPTAPRRPPAPGRGGRARSPASCPRLTPRRG